MITHFTPSQSTKEKAQAIVKMSDAPSHFLLGEVKLNFSLCQMTSLKSCFSALGSKALQYMEVGLSLRLSSTNVTTDRKKLTKVWLVFLYIFSWVCKIDPSTLTSKFNIIFIIYQVKSPPRTIIPIMNIKSLPFQAERRSQHYKGFWDPTI